MPNPVELLKADHAKVKQLFSQFESAKGAKKQEVFNQIFKELQVHTKVEEEIFYPAVKKIDKEGANEAFEEHNIVDFILGAMKKLSPSDEAYDAKFTTLKENVEHHIEEEEGEMFPEAQEKIPAAQMAELGTKMQERKDKLMAAGSRPARSSSATKTASRPATSRSRKAPAGSR
jgi:iron-sulfur cluster repair protein YtfE (RIC family)